MQALVYNGPWDLTVETVEDIRPGPGEVAIRVVATGICGSDIHGFSGENGRRSPGQVMGHEMVGRVQALGSDAVPRLRTGAPVTVNPLIACGSCAACAAGAEQSCPNRKVIGVDADIVSAFADVLVAPAQNVLELPEDMPIEYGALVEPLSVGYHAARRGECVEADRVLVTGGGPIGQAAILGARRLGATRIAVSEPHEARRELAASLGAEGLDPAVDGFGSRVRDVLGGAPTLVVDAVGTTRSLADAFASTGFGARVVLVGMNSPQIDLPAYAVSTAERTLIGSFCFTAQDFRDTAAWVGDAPAVLQNLVDGRVDMPGAPGAFAALANGESAASKVLVFPGGVPAGAG